ncbi:acyl carrier protein [Nocardia sp. alder85J]|uniref:acyl carrier protein n=1 Tax=Nocardia sp. alder85J TaxID=2862949 RepID=UPI001CD6DC2A|nr:acyl carrier protein [Nocardia sp. alder85J]MCX4096425.1 acyl carrier protein [Nocardia sp. alder85J]
MNRIGAEFFGGRTSADGRSRPGGTSVGNAVTGVDPARVRGRAAMTAAAVAAVAELVGVPGSEIATDAPFTDLGLTSTQLARLTAVLEDALGVEVSLTALYDHSDIGRLVEHLASS